VKEEITPEVERIRIVVIIIGIVRWIGVTVIVGIAVIVRRPGIIVIRRLGIRVVFLGIGNGGGLSVAHGTPHVTVAVAAPEEKECGEKARGQKSFS
jgi:hypothetical protein